MTILQGNIEYVCINPASSTGAVLDLGTISRKTQLAGYFTVNVARNLAAAVIQGTAFGHRPISRYYLFGIRPPRS